MKTSKFTEEQIAFALKQAEPLKDMDCKTLLCFAGNLMPHYDASKNIMIDNLKRLSEVAQKDGILIYIEPLNNIVDHVGHFLDNSATAAEIIKCVNSPNVKMIFDIYHMQVMEGNIIQTIKQNINIIKHFHSAGVPGRNEHHFGELNYQNIIKAIDNIGYKGYFGLEYFPTYDSNISIKDVLEYLQI
jgi:hydroxypyruvate isomerase